VEVTGRQFRLSDDDVRLVRGLTIRSDLELSNNLQINWSTGRKFHMTEHLETIACTG